MGVSENARIMNNDSYKELRRNTIIIAISNLGSRAISFILAPLYSYFMNTSEYGVMDMISVTAGLLLPFICIDVYEASFRFANDSILKKNEVLSSSLSICLICNFLIWSILTIFHIVIPLRLILLCFAYASIESLYTTLSYYVRGRKRMIQFAIGGIVNSVVLLALNVFLIIYLKMGLKGWIISIFISKIIAITYVAFVADLENDFRFSYIRKDLCKDMIKYCLPLMPSASMWWIMNTSDRYVITIYFGVSMTGIYAVANKLPSILSVLENIFYQSWQTTAINAIESSDKDNVYSIVFFSYFKLLSLGVMILLFFLKPLIIYLFAKSYHAAWVSSAVLVVGVMVHALASNLGTLYVVFKSTTGALKTSAIAAMSNIVLNLIFVKLYGMNAAAWTTLVGYVIVLVIRWFDTRKFVTIHIPNKESCELVLLILASLFLYYIDAWYSYAVRSIMIGIAVYFNKTALKRILRIN